MLQPVRQRQTNDGHNGLHSGASSIAAGAGAAAAADQLDEGTGTELLCYVRIGYISYSPNWQI